VEKKIVGYKADGTVVFEQRGIGTTAILYCEGCKKVLANTGGKKDVYCSHCAKNRGISIQK